MLEFNCRLGDPETQPILMRLNSDLVTLCDAALDGHIADIEVSWDKRCSLGVVMASAGYPDRYDIGLPIVLQDHPGSTDVSMSLELVLRMVDELPNIACIRHRQGLSCGYP